jgi:ABC-type multidrug transport system fused ATPase/permease subunit
VIENSRVPAYWPSSSNNDSLIIVENLEVKYAPELPAVLHDVSFKLKAGERIGLLGRTGLLLYIFVELNVLSCLQEAESPRWP